MPTATVHLSQPSKIPYRIIVGNEGIPPPFIISTRSSLLTDQANLLAADQLSSFYGKVIAILVLCMIYNYSIILISTRLNQLPSRKCSALHSASIIRILYLDVSRCHMSLCFILLLRSCPRSAETRTGTLSVI